MAKQPAKGRKTPAKTENEPSKSEINDESASVEAVLLVDPIPPEVHEDPVEMMSEAESQAEETVQPDETPVEEPLADVQEAADMAEPSPAVQPRGSVLPLLLGGLVAGGIGFVAAYLLNPQNDGSLADQVAAQATTIAELEARIAELPVVDLTGIETAQSELGVTMEALQSRFDDLSTTVDLRIAALEQLPTGNGDGTSLAIAAYEAQLEELRSEMEALSGAAITQLEDARAEAAAIEENAASAARAAAGRAALARIQTAMESGAPLGAALADLEQAIDGQAPDALLAAQDGVPTLASLQEAFPDVARAALATARSEGVAGEETSGVGAFLRNQFDVRSVAPREGTDADAILSRAEEAVRTGRLADGLAEVAALPEVARAEMTDWLAMAELRADAVAAVDILLTTLNAN